MSLINESFIQVWYKYQNVVKQFLFSGEAYKYKKITQKSAKAFERFLRILLRLCRSRFRLIILERNFKCKSEGAGVEKELFRKQ